MMNIRQLEIAVLGDEDLVSSLRLAGVRRYHVVTEGDKEEVRQVLSELLDEPAIGIIVMLEDYSSYVADLISQAQERKTSPPVVIEVPSKYGTRYKDVAQYYKSYIRKFIGFDIEI